eukprot:ANDGO_01937.mRNA.1 Integrator complex subunit 11 homolog
MRVLPLGAGQDVGRSCVVVTVGRKNIMFDCGMHMMYTDARRFPDFRFLTRGDSRTMNDVLDAVIITHFHLDHSGALPELTERFGFTGPVYMTLPTRAIAPILLEDFRKIAVGRRDEEGFYTSEDIAKCMDRVIPLGINQTVYLDDDTEIRTFYAGHVIGASMFYVKSGGESVVYSGDYNTTADRHLGSCKVDRVHPDLLITETTYCTTIRDLKRNREMEFLNDVLKCVTEQRGKVLIPVFALGRAQELCVLLESFWDRMGLTIPIYFSAGMVEKAGSYYQLFINWTNEAVKRSFEQQNNVFNFKHITSFDMECLDREEPCVILASPGMLHAGTSLKVFKRIATDARNLVIFPGYCVKGTVGYKVLNVDETKKVEIDKKTSLSVECRVDYMSFSAHADAAGIMRVISQMRPKGVLLVHGEKEKMAIFQKRVEDEVGVPCWYPANGVTVEIPTNPSIDFRIPADVHDGDAKQKLEFEFEESECKP